MILQVCFINAEAGTPKSYVKMVLLKVSQNSQESICVKDSY